MPTPDGDDELLSLLSKLQIKQLHEVLHKQRITVATIWQLTNEHLQEMGLTRGDIFSFNAAKQQYQGNEILTNAKSI